ncbi:fimbria/pilus chaperone family protein [Pantoea agglomerans]|nr:fimbria/pilus periplasmic chaperone [Enterobacter sp. DRP3]
MLHLKKMLASVCLLTSFHALAVGMVPDTSLLLVNEDEQGSSMDVKNTDANAQLLYTKIIDLPDDLQPGLIVTQPVVRVDAGKVQRVRFVLKNSGDKLNVEHLKRVIFRTIPQREKNKVKVVFSQNLPVIIRPAGLAVNYEPWKELQWHYKSGNLIVENKSPYVVRLEQKINSLPSGNSFQLPKTYILPGQSIIATPKDKVSGTDKQVKIFPATRFGYKADEFVADIK